MEATVTYTGSRRDSGSNYSGAINIPSTVMWNGKLYYVTSIGDGAFYKSNITSVVIPSSVKTIEEQAFINCYSLTSVIIPSSVTAIGESAFSGCRSLTSVNIPSSVTTIGGYAFRDCI